MAGAKESGTHLCNQKSPTCVQTSVNPGGADGPDPGSLDDPGFVDESQAVTGHIWRRRSGEEAPVQQVGRDAVVEPVAAGLAGGEIGADEPRALESSEAA